MSTRRKNKRTLNKFNWRTVLILVFLVFVGIFGYHWWTGTEEVLPPSPIEASEIAKIKILYISGGGFAELPREFYEISLVDGEYKSKEGIIIPHEYITQLKESLSDKVETQSFYSTGTITDVFLYQKAEILWGDGRKTILCSTSVGVPWWNILEEGQIYFQNTGRIPQSLGKIISVIKGDEVSQGQKQLCSTSLPPDLGKGEIPDEIKKGYIGFVEFEDVSWDIYGPFELRLRKNMDLKVKKAVLDTAQNSYNLKVKSTKEDLVLNTYLKENVSAIDFPFKGKVTIEYRYRGRQYITEGIINGFYIYNWKGKLTPGIMYESKRWVKDWKPFIREDDKEVDKIKITFQRPQGEVEEILVIDDCSKIQLATQDPSLTLPCDVVSENEKTVTILCNDSGKIHKHGEEISLCLGINTKISKNVKKMFASKLKGVWLADSSESMDKYLKLTHQVIGFRGFKIKESELKKNALEVMLEANQDIEILRMEKGYSDRQKIKTGENFTLYFKDIQDLGFDDFDDTFYPQQGVIEFVYRDVKDKFSYYITASVCKYAIKR